MSILYRIRNLLTVIAVIFMASGPAFAQKFKLNATIDTTSILIGDQLTFSIELEQPKDVKVVFPQLKDTISSKIEIVESEPTDTSKRANSWIIRKKYLITSFDSGYHKIPSYKFAFQINNTSDTISSQELFLTVNTVPVDTAKEIIDIKPVMRTPFSFKEIKHELIIGSLILLIIAISIWLFIRYKKNQPLFVPRKIQEPPHIIALKELDKLRSEKLWQNNQVKLYYTRLTDILRQYITGRFNVNAMEMTTDEILSSLEDELNRDIELKTSFTRLLVTADMVKFAKEVPLPEDNDLSLLSAYSFVNRTKIEVLINPNIPEDFSSVKTETGKEK